MRRNYLLLISIKINDKYQETHIVIRESIDKFLYRNINNDVIVKWFYEIDKRMYHRLRKTINPHKGCMNMVVLRNHDYNESVVTN